MGVEERLQAARHAPVVTMQHHAVGVVLAVLIRVLIGERLCDGDEVIERDRDVETEILEPVAPNPGERVGFASVAPPHLGNGVQLAVESDRRPRFLGSKVQILLLEIGPYILIICVLQRSEGTGVVETLEVDKLELHHVVDVTCGDVDAPLLAALFVASRDPVVGDLYAESVDEGAGPHVVFERIAFMYDRGQHALVQAANKGNLDRRVVFPERSWGHLRSRGVLIHLDAAGKREGRDQHEDRGD